MSKDDKTNINNDKPKANHWFGTEPNIEHVYAWFDHHPEPENIDCHSFSLSDHEDIEIFFANLVFETWLVKLTCRTARRAVFLSNLFYKTTSQMDITQILVNNKLFLFKDQRF